MRMRFKPYAGPELAACPFCVDEPMQNKGRWNGQFARPAQPLMLELGCGKGKFLAQMAVAHPENNYIGIDITARCSSSQSETSTAPMPRRAAR